MPSTRALAKLDLLPHGVLFSSKILYANGSMTMTRTRSSIINERSAVASIRPASTFLESCFAHFKMKAMMRNEMLEYCTNSANAKHGKQTIMATLTPLAHVSPEARIPIRGTAAANAHAVTTMGIGSQIHMMTQATRMPSSILPSKTSPSGVGRRYVTITMSIESAVIPTLKGSFSLIFTLQFQSK